MRKKKLLCAFLAVSMMAPDRLWKYRTECRKSRQHRRKNSSR